MKPEQLKTILEEHAKWRADPNTGTRADLSDANLIGADLSDAVGIAALLNCDGWQLTIVQHNDGPRFHAGCRWFTEKEARAHWDEDHAEPKHAAIMLAGCEALLALTKAMGWPEIQDADQN